MYSIVLVSCRFKWLYALRHTPYAQKEFSDQRKANSEFAISNNIHPNWLWL